MTRTNDETGTVWAVNGADRECFQAIAYSLLDNLGTTRAESTRFTNSVIVGRPAIYGPYTFLLEPDPT